MSSILSSLKLVAAKRSSVLDPIQFRRQRVSQKLLEQVSMAHALKNNETFTVKRQRNVRDENGLIQSVEVSKKPKEWWFVSNNKVCVQVRYGNKVVALTSKGDKNSVEVNNADELIAALTKLNEAVLNGELDSQIEVTSELVKARFKK
ncbi:MAG: hypothetical protein B7Y59_03910 [Burkholderiales bacterium 35-55-47]|jgi:hypothetical protein|uniref:DUF6641 family protein n=1 Tax=Limnohabitans sp. TaxID=1907725 RepID=UPI000BC44EB6|nr:DUF6641 family protein [Limnohabitans sp.]OYY20235.1 MAG: hypothetical protein B7Y59_03910 [Burkholderiales bacterium 35-55-47]OYZ74153.1 MAG: hypothetical protein B7Y06_01105 [Burkholderiales bacterium 24-55-52]OZB01955.1 MAG: hypothetical protein B7X62_03900 [Burkholderiales bacterium 39-55-53]HQR86485.1 hypothetical protein [Limnohabitans sp.]HQS25599.1 hypothetical protein [Limnohabitans sp.]